MRLRSFAAQRRLIKSGQVARRIWLVATLCAVAVVVGYAVSRALNPASFQGSSPTHAKVRVHPRTTAAISTTTAPATTAAAPRAAPPPSPVRTVRGSRDLLTAASLAPLAGRYVVARGARVLRVVGNEEFWIGRSTAQRVLVHLQTRTESPEHVVRGDVVSFRGVVARNAPGTAAAWGITPDEGARLLRRQGAHVVVLASRLRLAR